MADDDLKRGRFTQHEVAGIYDVPPWMLGPDIPRSRVEVIKWKLRWIPKTRRRALRVADKLLPKIGLMRVSQQPVKEIRISEGRLSVTLRNGVRWSGFQDRYGVKDTTVFNNPILKTDNRPEDHIG